MKIEQVIKCLADAVSLSSAKSVTDKTTQLFSEFGFSEDDSKNKLLTLRCGSGEPTFKHMACSCISHLLNECESVSGTDSHQRLISLANVMASRKMTLSKDVCDFVFDHFMVALPCAKEAVSEVKKGE